VWEELTCCHDLQVRFYLLERDECFHANSSGTQFFRFLLERNERRFLPCSTADMSADQQQQGGSTYLKCGEWDI